MSCIALIGGGIGCGKSTLIHYILINKTELLKDVDDNFEDQSECSENKKLDFNCYVIQFDSLCSIEEQEHLVWFLFTFSVLNFFLSVLLLHFLCIKHVGHEQPKCLIFLIQDLCYFFWFIINSMQHFFFFFLQMKSVHGLRNFRSDLLMAAERLITETCRSEKGLVGPLTERSNNLFFRLNSINDTSRCISPHTIIFVEDNFYYRSMRYDWLQIARRSEYVTVHFQFIST